MLQVELHSRIRCSDNDCDDTFWFHVTMVTGNGIDLTTAFLVLPCQLAQFDDFLPLHGQLLYRYHVNPARRAKVASSPNSLAIPESLSNFNGVTQNVLTIVRNCNRPMIFIKSGWRFGAPISGSRLTVVHEYDCQFPNQLLSIRAWMDPTIFEKALLSCGQFHDESDQTLTRLPPSGVSSIQSLSTPVKLKAWMLRPSRPIIRPSYYACSAKWN